VRGRSRSSLGQRLGGGCKTCGEVNSETESCTDTKRWRRGKFSTTGRWYRGTIPDGRASLKSIPKLQAAPVVQERKCCRRRRGKPEANNPVLKEKKGAFLLRKDKDPSKVSITRRKSDAVSEDGEAPSPQAETGKRGGFGNVERGGKTRRVRRVR